MEAVDEIDKGTFQTFTQDHDKATPAPKLYTDDCKVDFHQPAEKIHNKIRGLSPFPTAWAVLDDLKFNLYRSEIGPNRELVPGKLAMNEDKLLAGCEPGTVVLKEVQLQGKRRMQGKEFMNGYNGTGILH
jgi:methionyl-tRNA formyltransferase